MSKVMLGRFIKLLKEAYQNNLIQFPGKLSNISNQNSFKQFYNNLYKETYEQDY